MSQFAEDLDLICHSLQDSFSLTSESFACMYSSSPVSYPFLMLLFLHSATFKCNTCKLSHWSNYCPEPCTSSLPCSLKPEYSSGWPCSVCCDKGNKGTPPRWSTPPPHRPTPLCNIFIFYFLASHIL